MDAIQIWWNELYSNNPQMALVLIGAFTGAVATALFSKFLPAVISSLGNSLSFLGAKIGGRFGFKNIQDIYLNWVVLANQDLNLTGVIGSAEKPKLDQIFISLNIRKEPEDHSKEEEKRYRIDDTKWSIQKPIKLASGYLIKNIFGGLNNYFRWIFNKIFPSQSIGNYIIYRPSRIWRLHQYRDRGMHYYLALILIELLPIYGFILRSNIDNFAMMFSVLIWTVMDAIFFMEYIANEDDIGWETFLLYSTIPHMLIIYSIVSESTIGQQKPWGILILFIVALAFAFGTYHIDKAKRTNKHIAEEVGALFSKERVAILGKPGCGKSTYLQFIALTFAEEKAGNKKHRKSGIVKKRFGKIRWHLPIVIPLQKVAHFIVESRSETSENLIIEAFRQRVLPSHVSSKFSSEYVRHMLQRKKCVILLDGIDEVTNDIEFHATINEIKGLVSRYPGNKFIITSRYSGWRGGVGTSFEQYDVNDLDTSQISEFIDNWCFAIEQNRGNILGVPKTDVAQQYRRIVARERAINLKAALDRNSSIRKLAENPLLLSIICYVHYQKALPEERINLYQKCSELLLDQWDREKGLALDDTNLTSARKEAIIEEIAFALHSGKIGKDSERKDFTTEEVIPIVQELLIKFRMAPTTASELFKKLVERSGVIVSVEKFRNKYAFSHLTFQEYYAAKYLCDSNLDIFATVEEIEGNSLKTFPAWWREVLLLYSALQRDATWIIRKLGSSDHFDLTKLKLQLATQCLQEAVCISDPTVENQILSQLYEIRLLGKNSKYTRAWPSEVRQYLLRYGLSEKFSFDALKLAIDNAERMTITKKFMTTFIKLLYSTDATVVLNAIELLIQRGPKSKVMHELGPVALKGLLESNNPEVQLGAIRLILHAFTGRYYKSLREKAVEIFLAILPEKLSESLSLNEEALRDVVGLLPREKSKFIRDKIQMRFTEILYRTLQENNINYQLCQAVAEALFEIEDSNLVLMHKQQIQNMLLYGDEERQLYSIMLLRENFNTEPSIINLILAQLKSPLVSIRRSTLKAIQSSLKLDGHQLSNTIVSLRKVKSTRSILSDPYYRFLESIIGRGVVGTTRAECALALQALLHLESLPNDDLRKRLISIYQKLSTETRWSVIKFLTEEAARKISADEWDQIINLYEKDQKSEAKWEPSSHDNALSTLRWIGKRSLCSDIGKMVQLLLTDAKNPDEVTSINALLALNDIKIPMGKDSEYYSLLCKNLLCKRQDIADRAFGVLFAT